MVYAKNILALEGLKKYWGRSVKLPSDYPLNTLWIHPCRYLKMISKWSWTAVDEWSVIEVWVNSHLSRLRQISRIVGTSYTVLQTVDLDDHAALMMEYYWLNRLGKIWGGRNGG